MALQQMQPHVLYAEKQFGTLEYKLSNTHDQQLDQAQQLWSDWYENNIPDKQPKKFVGSGEDVCLNSL